MSNQDHKLRLDVITIFPEYLEPLRHALLGKAIEQGILTVGVHDLRDWATGNHKSVDSPPLGGGPGMVMKPQVWGPALDSVAQGRVGADLETAVQHRNDKLRHDDVAEVAPRPYAKAEDASEEDATKPLLLVPTPAGTPFTQADAQAWSREKHIVFACGRYEGIDQRVFEDAAKRYRVREVSIGDYVLIGGEVAVLVIAEAVTRLIPGVLGNTESHEDDSFSDGLLEGPSYTKPRVWRGIEAPAVLTSGDHAKVEQWRREQSLKRTSAVRPELLETARLSDEDRFMLYAQDVVTELDVLGWRRGVEKHMRRALKKAGYRVESIKAVERGTDVCFGPSMLETEYERREGRPCLEPLVKLTVRGRTALEPVEATKAVVAALPRGADWYGSTRVV
ncbi:MULTISPECIES: tRNA (guanosine(37)-N1)-methyltransferase TrmD [Corynebacterium]|uniref:tRNA (guanine-N(1)-)-methyltransferase n=1 Tax=Corynebacterium riegelii TaxID=156976 RepID=A0A0K1RAC5_9CORY|nr:MULTISPECIES: tRNA (guanosine(37)-N1)-methyltransferase TrmD [Corynebacterium]AKV58141.1 tRNA (guanine-N1)-methyltransferase [Corynebacterium riegelii]MDK7179296.1 tRNA (guanosine(37)-N1)-methyltransferase TrmD [Corynebacterium riegelii]OFT74100.1 tRNA (guanine(37)-N(1))-methyltransferase [Corynebacterium sp. HMSC30G07]